MNDDSSYTPVAELVHMATASRSLGNAVFISGDFTPSRKSGVPWQRRQEEQNLRICEQLLARHNVLPFHWGKMTMNFLALCPRQPGLALDLFSCIVLNSPLHNQNDSESEVEKRGVSEREQSPPAAGTRGLWPSGPSPVTAPHGLCPATLSHRLLHRLLRQIAPSA